jgi:lipopolysaccharide transport system ATP-binding protein
MKPILELQEISKKFRINHETQPYLNLRDTLVNFFKHNSTKEDFWALKEISLNIMQGDTVGIIGKNGAGKSTLLKILSKITPPTNGRIISRGRIASLLEVGTGFHPELSGRENVFMNGSILGMQRAEIKKNFEAIVDFAGVEKFIDTPLKHFSSGMQLRLAFAVAAFLENEILIIDEVLAVGDLEFQKKCMGKMEDVSKSGRTILFVSHNMGAIQDLCKKAVLLQKGKLTNYGQTKAVISDYLFSSNNLSTSIYLGPNDSNKRLWFKKIELITKDFEQINTFNHNESILINFDIGGDLSSHDYSIFFMVLDKYKKRVFASESSVIKSKITVAEIESDFLVRGDYSIQAFIHKPQIAQIDAVEDVCNFTILDVGSPLSIHGDYDYGSVFGKVKWRQ